MTFLKFQNSIGNIKLMKNDVTVSNSLCNDNENSMPLFGSAILQLEALDQVSISCSLLSNLATNQL